MARAGGCGAQQDHQLTKADRGPQDWVSVSVSTGGVSTATNSLMTLNPTQWLTPYFAHMARWLDSFLMVWTLFIDSSKEPHHPELCNWLIQGATSFKKLWHRLTHVTWVRSHLDPCQQFLLNLTLEVDSKGLTISIEDQSKEHLLFCVDCWN